MKSKTVKTPKKKTNLAPEHQETVEQRLETLEQEVKALKQIIIGQEPCIIPPGTPESEIMPMVVQWARSHDDSLKK